MLLLFLQLKFIIAGIYCGKKLRDRDFNINFLIQLFQYHLLNNLSLFHQFERTYASCTKFSQCLGLLLVVPFI